jgi:hypothetical protein
LRRLIILCAAVSLALAMTAAPALATVHPIQSGDCNAFNAPFSPSGGDPPGITGGSQADNFAQPLDAVFSSSGQAAKGFPALNGDNGNCPNGSPQF